MKKSPVILFWLRLFIYFSVIALILIHPGISVSFDRISFAQWFIIIPLLAFIAFVSPQKHSFKKRCIAAVISLLFIVMWLGGFSLSSIQLFLAGIVSFILTYLLFNYPHWAKASALEPFFLAWVCLRLLALSRSSEDVAGQSMALTQFIFVWAIAVFLLDSFIIYLCLFPKSTGGAGKEGGLFALSALGLLVLVLVVLPLDFVRNSVIENLLPEGKPEMIKEGVEHGIPRDSDGDGRQNKNNENSENNRRPGRPTIPRGDDSRKQKLRGISEHNWQNKSSRNKGKKGKSEKGKGKSNEESEEEGEGQGHAKKSSSDNDNRQYMVMIVAADREPVYMADTYKGQLDPLEGFLSSPQEPLNKLSDQRFFTTWFDNEPEVDRGRERQEVIALSTLPRKYLPYRPVSIDPTILNENSGPLRYIHQVVSSTHLDDPLSLVVIPSRPLSSFEKNLLAPYMEISLYEADEKVFREYLNTVLEKWRKERKQILAKLTGQENPEEIFNPVNDYLEKIFALQTNFLTYKYNLDYTDDVTIDAIKDFVFDSMDGDCSQFSNTLALLGRLAGIPSRVVTGFLAAESMQTEAHIKGLFNLRNKIPFLQQFPLENLFLVTNLHHHSWTQFYIPDYGWLDFESTLFSIPPIGMGDFHGWDVVIPLINEQRVFSQLRKFPWLAVLRTAGIMAVLALVCAYALRYGRELALYLGVKRRGRAGARSLYLLLLARLSADGKPIKPADKTALEYAKLFPFTKTGEGENPHFKNFASIYTELRWREFKDSAQMDERFSLLEQEYHNILETTRQKGILGWFIRLISLRGLGYL
ncbi:MAG: transglutaminase-like domain-containing protein [Treponema sp.]|jgi:transglutaminase-like putative cysteine protease|nr:transglutaminase-like domain-containing protein [Treponema sp.]